MPADGRDDRAMAERLVQHLPEPLVRFFQKDVRPRLPDVSFITLHYLYFIVTSMIASIIFWGSSTPSKSVSYTDSLFLAVSAMTEAGLNTVNLSELNTWQQVMLFILIMMGSAIFVSIAILHIRMRAFERKLEDLAEHRELRRTSLTRSFTFSRSKRRASASQLGDREGAIVSGVVRGTPIHDKPDEKEPEQKLNDDGHHHDGAANGQLRLDAALDGANGDVRSPEPESSHIRFDNNVHSPWERGGDLSPVNHLHTTHSRIFTGSGVGVRGLAAHPKNAPPPSHWEDDDLAGETESGYARLGSIAKIDRWIVEMGGFVGRNSQFHGLNEKDRKKLGGIEYDAVCMLSWIVPLYFVLWQLLGAIGVGAWLQINRPDTALTNGLNPFWAGAFFAISAFNNSGMALLDANAVALQTSYYSLLTLSILILAGNTCFPPFLRLCVWCMKKAIPESADSPAWDSRRRTLDFILTHPRRVYTNLFPSAQTWWLVGSLVILNGIDWIAFEVLNIGNPVTDVLPGHFRVLDGLFQAFAVRSGGFYVVNISGLYPGLLVLYVLMMYVSALPVSMTIRNTNVYEERSLGIFSEDQDQDQGDPSNGNGNYDPEKAPGVIGKLKRTLTNIPTGHSGPAVAPQTSSGHSWKRQDFIRQQLRGQLSHDLWWLALAVLFITIIETSQFHRDPVVFSVFNIIFEVVSGYGCVGISTGVPWNAYSFSGAWHTSSKLILCAVMLRGRHRGLPVAIDKAVLLPDETLAWAEEEDADTRRRKREGRSRSRGARSQNRRDGNPGSGRGMKRASTGFSSGLDARAAVARGGGGDKKEERGREKVNGRGKGRGEEGVELDHSRTV